MTDRNAAMARRVAEAVARAGGRTFFVGGCVRDALLGLENKDIDIEVHGIPVATLERLLDGLGERTEMGASFGIMGLKHYELDIAMPRSETATGRGHRDFDVIVDPFIGPERAALRRDFTMNALMQDVLTGELLDFFGGREDMARRRIRHVNDATFAEDPLRVFRAAQFAARFGFEVAEQTAALSAGMDVTALASERVLGELEKALLKAARPSVFFEALRRMNQLSPWFAELAALDGAGWARAMAALDGAARLRKAAADPRAFMTAALCLGPEDAAGLLKRLTDEAQLTRFALNTAGQLRALAAALEGETDECGWMRLFDGAVSPESVLLLARGTLPAARWAACGPRLDALLALYRERMGQPRVMGRDLLTAGARPGPRMGAALARAHALQLTGAPWRERLEAALSVLEAGE